MLTKRQLLFKRIFDITLSFFGLIVLIVPLLILVIVSTFISGSFGIFKQERVGQHAKLFTIYKIKTMTDSKSLKNSNVVVISDESRILVDESQQVTSFGKILRKYKLDEFPQLFNVLIGDMSFVGPRPDVLGYADKLVGTNRVILSVKPGITGPATLAFRNENELLSNNSDPVKYNNEIIWPQKVKLNLEYIEGWSLKKDIIYIFKTIFN